jgi:hypothetical protein
MAKQHLSALVTPLALAGALLVATPVVSYAQNCENGNKTGNKHCNEDPLPPTAATPELDSLVLFGVGGLALAGLAWRQRRKPPA